MSKSTVKVVEIDTNPAVKSLKDLRKELKDFKDQMANLEEGSDAFLEIANKAGEVKHQIDEINESIKGASADFGDMVGNVTNVAAGITGAFQAVAGGLQAMGIESKALDETIAKMQGLMAVTQGLGSIDTAIKSLDKLRNSITATTGAAKLLKAALQPKIFLAITAVVAGLTFAFNKLKGKVDEVKTAQEEYNKKLQEERELNTNNQIDARLRYLNKELRIKEAIASVKYGDDELKYKQEMLRAYTTELERAEANIRNVENFDPGEAYYKKLGIDRATFIEGLKKERDEIKKLREQTEDDIAVITAKNAEIAKLPKTTKKTKTKEEILNELGLVEFTDKDLQEGLDRVRQYYEELYDIQLEQNKRREKDDDGTEWTEEKRLAKEIEIEKERLKIYEEGSLERERQLTKIWELENELNELVKENTEVLISRNEQIEKLGNEIFDNLKSSMGKFAESSLGLTDGWIKSLDEFQLAFQQTMKIVKTDGEKSWTAYGNVAATALSGIGSILNSLSNEQDASNKEGFEQMKKLQIAATVMNMLSGIMSAWTSAMNPANAWMTIWGQVATGTAMSGMIAGIGAAQIEKIKSQTMQSANPNTNINAKTVNSMIVPPVQYSSAVQGASTEGAIKDTKVYVTETDIVNTMSKVKVQETENTY